jgi:hypothetical protein
VNTPVFHRHATDYFSADEWGNLSPANQRVARVLGATPLTDARHLLQPIASPQPPPVEDSSLAFQESDVRVTITNADFAVRLSPTTPRTVAEAYPHFAPGVRAVLDFPRVVAHIPSRGGDGERAVPFQDAPENARVRAVTLIWSLPDLISIGNERDAVADLRRFLVEAGKIGIDGAMTVTPLQDPAESAHRAVTLRALLRKVGGQAGLRLVPASGSFASRDVWRALYSLGLEWGSMDLFHWSGGTGTSQFRVLSSGNPPYFLPERAAEGERVPGLVLEYDLPRSPDPLAVFDRMAVALSYLRSILGGRPLTSHGAELDAERLDEERDALEDAVQALTNAGIAPGSETARRFF